MRLATRLEGALSAPRTLAEIFRPSAPCGPLDILRAAHHAARRAYVVHVVEDPPGRLPQAHEVWVEDSTGLVTLARNFVRPTQSAQP